MLWGAGRATCPRERCFQNPPLLWPCCSCPLGSRQACSGSFTIPALQVPQKGKQQGSRLATVGLGCWGPKHSDPSAAQATRTTCCGCQAPPHLHTCLQDGPANHTPALSSASPHANQGPGRHSASCTPSNRPYVSHLDPS